MTIHQSLAMFFWVLKAEELLKIKGIRELGSTNNSDSS